MSLIVNQSKLKRSKTSFFLFYDIILLGDKMNAVIKVSDETKEKMIEYYDELKKDKEIPYTVFQAQDGDTTVTMYTSGKVMFQGVSADVDANMWREIDGQKTEEQTKKDNHDEALRNESSVGSDEVGTGDYFGPIVVSAAYVDKKDIKYLEELGVGDSKKINDDRIKVLAPKIIKRVKYRSLVLDNIKYNQLHAENNMNKLKAVLHNKVLYSLIKEEKINCKLIVVDEFAKEKRYYEYIKDSPNIQRGISFMTKAEDKNLAVACASIISRYLFLREFDRLSDSLKIALPKGAGPVVDTVAKEVVEKYGKEKLKEVAKYNFNNTQRIIGNVIM